MILYNYGIIIGAIESAPILGAYELTFFIGEIQT